MRSLSPASGLCDRTNVESRNDFSNDPLVLVDSDVIFGDSEPLMMLL